MVDLVEEGFDLAVRIARLPNSSLVSASSQRRGWCCAPHQSTCAAAAPRSIPSELAQHDVIGYSLLSMGDQWHFDGPAGPGSVRVRPRMLDATTATPASGGAARRASTCSRRFWSRELAPGTLVEVLPQYRSIELGVYAMYPTRKFVLPKVRALVEYLSEKLTRGLDLAFEALHVSAEVGHAIA